MIGWGIMVYAHNNIFRIRQIYFKKLQKLFLKRKTKKLEKYIGKVFPCHHQRQCQ
jgi:hypothetical protein